MIADTDPETELCLGLIKRLKRAEKKREQKPLGVEPGKKADYPEKSQNELRLNQGRVMINCS